MYVDNTYDTSRIHVHGDLESSIPHKQKKKNQQLYADMYMYA